MSISPLKAVHAGNSMVTPQIVRFAVIGREVETMRLHPVQLCAISMLYEAVAVQNVRELHSLEDIDAVRHLASKYQPSTFMGMKIEQDATMPEDQIEFLAKGGEPISLIKYLAIPV